MRLEDERKPFAPVFGEVYVNKNGSTYRCIDRVPPEMRTDPCNALMQSTIVASWGAWTFMAKGICVYPGGSIEWDHSVGGTFEKPVFDTCVSCCDPIYNVIPG